MAAGDLCTVADVRAVLQKATSDTAQDPVIQTFITWASEDITLLCEREFVDSGVGSTRTFEAELGHDGMFLNLTPFDLRGSPSQVRLDTDQATPITLSTDEYRVYPVTTRYGVYTALRIQPLSRSLGRVMYRNIQVQVTGTWGFLAVPASVQKACAITAATWVRAHVSAFSTTFQPDQNTIERPEALPSAVARGLQRWKHVTL